MPDDQAEGLWVQNVVGLHGEKPNLKPGETDPALIAFIEDLLRRAKEGKILGLVGALMQENGEPLKWSETHVFCDTGSHNAMLGLVEVAKHRLVVKILEDEL
jgi:hypothetical protein